MTGIANGAVMTGPRRQHQCPGGCRQRQLRLEHVGYASSRQPGLVIRWIPTLGGISTANGGNVTIQAGGDITAALPGSDATCPDFGSGAFGAAPGNVTLTRRRRCDRALCCGQRHGDDHRSQRGRQQQPKLALSLVEGAWVVTAAT